MKERLERVRAMMIQAAARSGRASKEVALVAVTKGVPPDRIVEAQEAGLSVFGESKVQEAAAKIPLVQAAAEWHLIGHLQTNKIPAALSLFQVIQSVDSLRLAKAIHEAALTQQKTASVFLEVNISGEAQKYGFNPEEIYSAADAVAKLAGLRVLGLMGIAPNTADAGARREAFGSLRKLFGILKSMKKPNFEMKHLSMGMSDDFEIAIEEGSTMIRLGRALFQ